MVVCNEGEAGANACLAYHSFNYVVEKLAKGFEVLEFKGTGGQDFYLLRKLTDYNNKTRADTYER